MNLTEELAKRRASATGRHPADVRATMKKAADNLAASGMAQSALQEGARAPDFSLPNHRGQTVSAAALLDKGPVVISFYRGGWCPYCNIELRALQERLPEISDLGASLVAITPELPDKTLSTAEKYALEFEVLSDSGNDVARRFGIVYALAEELRPIYETFGIDIVKSNGDESYELPLTATYVVDRDGTVRKAYVDTDHTRRLDPDEIVDALRRMTDA